MVFKDPHADINDLPVKFRAAFARWRKIKLTPMSERFWKKVAVGSAKECWPFMGNRNTAGYGVFSPSANHEGRMLAHRMAWKITHGDIPPGGLICHNCDNPPCCNPGHLFCGTPLDNVQDCMNKGRFNHARGEQCHGAKLKEKDVVEIRKMAAYGGIQNKTIAAIYGIDRSYIGKIIKRIKWRHVP